MRNEAHHADGMTWSHVGHLTREVWREYQSLKTPEAKAVYADNLVSTWAREFEKTWPVLYELLHQIEAEEIYRKPYRLGSDPPSPVYDSFKDYFVARVGQSFERWAELEKTYRYAERYGPDLFRGPYAEAQAEAALKAQKDNEEDRKNVSRQGQRTDLIDTEKRGINKVRPDGTSAAAAHRRLRKDRPDLHARVLAGELSPNTAMIEAGFRKKAKSRKKTALDLLRKWWRKASPEEKQTFIDEVTADHSSSVGS
jgi:hypothetical protein